MEFKKAYLKQIIKEELREALDLNMLKHYDEEKDWGSEGNRFDTARLRSQFPLPSDEALEDDHVEVAIRDAIHDGKDVEEFANESTLVQGVSNAEVVYNIFGDDVKNLWRSWEQEGY